jgi:hypothetical protein
MKITVRGAQFSKVLNSYSNTLGKCTISVIPMNVGILNELKILGSHLY